MVMLDNLATAAKVVLEDIYLYNSNSFLIPLFVVALVFLWIFEKDRNIKVALVYLTAVLAVTFVCPIYVMIGMKIDEDIYYRVMWALPMGIIVCYSVVKLMTRFKNIFAKILVFVLAILVICINGDLVYTKTLHFKSVNAYHMPQVVIDVADALKLDKYKPAVVFPAELLPFIRQYSADFYTPYGRNILEPSWTFYSELYDAMEGDSEAYDIPEVARCAKNEHCAFVVLSSIKKMNGSMEDEGYFLVNFVQGYYIYMDYNYYWVYKEQGLLDDDILEIGG
jgi:hypothetical protein